MAEAESKLEPCLSARQTDRPLAGPDTIPRVRFAVDFQDDESIPGMIVRASANHVLHRVGLVFAAAQVNCPYPGHAQLLPRIDLDRLAIAIRADPERMAANAGERINSTNFGATHQRARFGDLMLLRAHLELARRRIGPVSLRSDDYHRLAWLSKILPYCPQSLERLVDTCSHCTTVLGWTKTWGIGVCESCEDTVLPSAEPSLPRDMADHYRLFAALASPINGERAAARSSLPERLQGLSYATLVRLACRIGLICRDNPIVKCTQHDLDELTPEKLASVVTTGAAMLADWPISFERLVHARANNLRDDREGFQHWRILLRRISVAKSEGEEQSALILEVLPDLKGSFERSFAGSRRYYLPNEAARVLGVPHYAVLRAVDAGAIKTTCLPGITRRRMQLDAEQVDDIGEMVRSVPAIHALPGKLGVPLYGVEQLIDARLIHRECHPGVLAVRDWVCIQKQSLDDLVAGLDGAMQVSAIPGDTTSIRAASRRIGGREKPWAAIIEAILTGRLPNWSGDGSFNVHKVFVRPADMAQFDGIVFTPSGSAFPFSKLISQEDVGELLNIAPKYLPAVQEYFGLQFVEVGRAECANKATVLGIAMQMASSAEIGQQMGVHSRTASTAMRKRAINAVSVGWDRAQLIANGTLPY